MDGRLTGQHGEDWALGGELAEDWSRQLAKHLAPAAQARQGVVVQTILGAYRLDLVVQLGPLRVGFVCEAEGWRPGFTDLWRDAALVGPGAARVVYHLRSVDLHNHLEDCLYVVSRGDARLFSLRGRTNLSILASDTIRRVRLPREYVAVDYPKHLDEEWDADPSGDPADVIVEALPRETEGSLHMIRRDRALLLQWYEAARRSGARSVEQVMQWFAAEQLREPE